MLDPRLKLRHLQALVAVYARRSVQASAHDLSRTPSAVSKSLAEFEAIVGTRLFERTRRGLLPTPGVERLLEQVNRALMLLDAAIDHSTGRAGKVDAPAVTMGVLPTAASTLAPAAVQAFQADYPDAIVRVIEGTNIELLTRLRQRALDLVVGRLADAALMFDLSFEPLFEEPLMLVAAKGHPLEHARSPSLDDVCAHPMILPERDTIIRSALDPFLVARDRVRPCRVIETLSDAFARQLVVQSDAVWFCAPGVVSLDLTSRRFIAIDIDLGSTKRAVGLSMRGDVPLSPAAADMAELLRLQARRLRSARAAPAVK